MHRSYNKGVLGINFITLFSFVAIQTFFGYREYFVIEAFDLDPTLPADNLRQAHATTPRRACHCGTLTRICCRVQRGA